jgi:proteasome lid subunit RPN8/RPN11
MAINNMRGGESKNESHRIFRRQVRAFLKLAVKSSKTEGREICGLLLSNGYCLELVLTQNKTKRPGGFSFYSREVLKIERAAPFLNYRIVGTFHSHPWSSAVPGKSDIEYAEDDSLMLIISCWDKEANLWRIYNRKAHQVKLEYV